MKESNVNTPANNQKQLDRIAEKRRNMDDYNGKRAMNLEALLPSGFDVEGRIVGQEFGISGYLHQAGFVELDDGSLLIACGGTKIPGHAGGDYKGVWTYLWRSFDGGKTWGEVPTPFLKNAVNDKLCTSNPCLLKLSGDRLVMLARSATEYAWESSTYVMISFDNGNTWGSHGSEGTDWKWTTIIEFDNEKGDTCPPTGDSGFNRAGPCCYSCRPIRLESGRLLLMLAASWHESPPSTTQGGAYYFRSDDEGATWQYHGMIERPPTGEVLCEPATAELPDGRLVALVRSYNSILEDNGSLLTYKGSRYYYLSFSYDQGATWSQAWPVYLGSERWNGAMADIAVAGNFLYALGSFSQFQPPDFSGAPEYWEEGTQRTPLLLLRIPLEQIAANRKGAYDLVPDVIKPVGVTLSRDMQLASKFASVQLDLLNDGSLGVLCDTHTGSFDKNDILFWRVAPEWFDDAENALALWRGPVPGVYDNGGIRILNSQTTIRPKNFPSGQFPLTVKARMTKYNLERRECIRQNLITLWTTAELCVPAAPYPNTIFASLDVNTQLARNGPHQFIVNTGEGLVDIGLPVRSDHEYEVSFNVPNRWEWFLSIDGKRFGPFSPVVPGLPGSLTLAHEMHPAREIDVLFRDIICEGEGDAILLTHPFLVGEVEITNGVPRDQCGMLSFMQENSCFRADLTGAHWARWLRYGGISGVYDELPEEEALFSISGNGEVFVELVVKNGTLIAQMGGAAVSLATGGSGKFSLAASALHERTYLTNGRDTARPLIQPFMPIRDAPGLVLRVSKHIRHLWFTGWDAPPAGQLRLLAGHEEWPEYPAQCRDRHIAKPTSDCHLGMVVT